MGEQNSLTDVYNDKLGHMPFSWLQDRLDPEIIALAIGGLFVICTCAVIGGRRVVMRLGPFMLDIM